MRLADKIPELLSVYKELQTEWAIASAEIYKSAGRDIICKKGCSYCCYGKHLIDAPTNRPVFSVNIFAVEGILIKRKFNSLSLSKKRFVVAAHHQRLHANHDFYFEKCVFLDDRGHCMIYNARPYMCRAFGLPVRRKIDNPSASMERARRQGVIVGAVSDYQDCTCDLYSQVDVLRIETHSDYPWAKQWIDAMLHAEERLYEMNSINGRVMYGPLSTFILNEIL